MDVKDKIKLLNNFEDISYHSVDDKGRFIVPVRFRNVLKKEGGDCVVLTSIYGKKSISAYTLNKWNMLAPAIWDKRDESDEMESFSRHFISHSKKCFFDRQGRVVIPATLREIANIDKEIILLGLFDKFEIWTKTNLDEDTRILSKNKVKNLKL